MILKKFKINLKAKKFVPLGLFQTPTWPQFLFGGENEKEIEFLGAVDLEAVTITDKVIVE